MTFPTAETGAGQAPRAPHGLAPAHLSGRDLTTAAGLALAWWLVLCWAMHGYVSSDYFPIADQWALIANSHPAFAHPLQWFTQGFSDYFVYDPAVSRPYANFIRPGFNGWLWLFGLFLSPESGAYLYPVYAVMGVCAGVVYLLLRQQSAAPAWMALLLAALVPLTPPLVPEIGNLLTAYGPFDPLAAILGLFAIMSWSRGRWLLTALLLLLAVFTKETSLPVLGALLLLSLWRWWSGRGQGASLLPAVLIATPLLLWAGLRLAVFGNTAGGVYVLGGSLLHQLAHQALQWPFWLETLPFHLDAPAGQKLAAWLLLAANLGFALASAGIVGRRVLVLKQAPHPVELALLLSWGFMILVGVSDRLGAVLCLCLVGSLGTWLGERREPRLVALAAASLLLGLGATAWRMPARWQEIVPLVVDYSRVSRAYLAELKTFAPEDTVVVLNDPASWHSQARWLRQAGAVPAQLVKVADFACPASSLRLRQPCAVSLQPGEAPGEYSFAQSCGIDWCGAFVTHDQPVRLSPAPGMQAELLPGATASGATDWTRLRLTLPQGHFKLLYFDPADRSFHRLDPAAATPEKSP